MAAIRRVNVKGTSGSGKSSFARELAVRLGVPYVELDALNRGSDSTPTTSEELRARVGEVMGDAPEGWVIDGNYEDKLGETVIGAADTIVWLDLPLALKARRLLARTRDPVRRQPRDRAARALWWTLRSHVRHRRRWPRAYADDPRFVRLRSVAEVKDWLAGRGRKAT